MLSHSLCVPPLRRVAHDGRGGRRSAILDAVALVSGGGGGVGATGYLPARSPPCPAAGLEKPYAPAAGQGRIYQPTFAGIVDTRGRTDGTGV